MHLVDEHQRGPWRLAGTRLLGALDRLADVAHAAQYGADGDEIGLKSVRHEPRQRGFSDPRRPPQDAAVRLPGLEGHAQRLARPEQVRLPDHLGQRLRAQPFGQGAGVGLHGAQWWTCGLIRGSFGPDQGGPGWHAEAEMAGPKGALGVEPLKGDV